MRNKRELTRGSREEDEKATYQTVGTMTPNRRLIAQYSDVYRPIIDTYFCRMHVQPGYTCALVYKSVHTWSQQPNVTPNLRQRMLHRSMCIRRRENAIELSRILFERRATSTSRAGDNPQGRRFR